MLDSRSGACRYPIETIITRHAFSTRSISEPAESRTGNSQYFSMEMWHVRRRCLRTIVNSTLLRSIYEPRNLKIHILIRPAPSLPNPSLLHSDMLLYLGKERGRAITEWLLRSKSWSRRSRGSLSGGKPGSKKRRTSEQGLLLVRED
jgi:hypothetical protein